MGACGGRHAPGTYQDIPLGVSVLTIYEACSLIFMFVSQLNTYNPICNNDNER